MWWYIGSITTPFCWAFSGVLLIAIVELLQCVPHTHRAPATFTLEMLFWAVFDETRCSPPVAVCPVAVCDVLAVAWWEEVAPMFALICFRLAPLLTTADHPFSVTFRVKFHISVLAAVSRIWWFIVSIVLIFMWPEANATLQIAPARDPLFAVQICWFNRAHCKINAGN